MKSSSRLKRLSNYLFLFLFLAWPFFLQAQLKINEIMPKNVSFLLDRSYITRIIKNTSTGTRDTLSRAWENTYNYSMWVEVFNTTYSSKQLNAFYFTDDLSNKKKWNPSIVNGSISGRAYAVLFFERDDEEGFASYTLTDNLYLLNRGGQSTFKLDPDGGKLYLLNSSLTVIDSVVYPAQYRNISYGRITDAADQWVFFDFPSPGKSNNGKTWGTQRCPNPVFSLKNGFYTTTQYLGFAMPASRDTIFYTTNGDEPTRSSFRYVPGNTISLASGVSKIRAKTYSFGKLASDVVTNTYFIGQRSFNNLPVVSLVTDQKNLTDNTIGIYCDGTNGIPGNGQTTNRNYNQDWSRPANFEFFDKTGKPQLNQELDIKILGGWTRSNPQKSTAIGPKKKFGNNMLDYDFFAGSKPGHKYKDIQLRNSGNDFNVTQMRDGFILSLVAKRMDVDYLGYEPCVVFLNGSYHGIQNLRERSNADFVFSNHGYDEEDVELLEAVAVNVETSNDIPTDSSFARLSRFLKYNDLSKPEIYRQACDSIDVDEFINYMIPQIYCANNDWPYNNVKMWRKKNGGKWRWILFDTDFGFEPSRASHNSLTFALGENNSNNVGYSKVPEWAYIVLKSLCSNTEFLNKFIDRFAIHLSTTFTPERVDYVMDSIANRIDEEYSFHKAKWGGSDVLQATLNGWKNFASNRNKTMLGFISNRFLNGAESKNLTLASNISGASYTLNGQPVVEEKVSIGYFAGRNVSLKANRVNGYKFDHWACATDLSLLPMKSDWVYYYDSIAPPSNWFDMSFDESSWKSGAAPLGYGLVPMGTKIISDVIRARRDLLGKFKTAYFRKKLQVDNLYDKKNIVFKLSVCDGAIVYVNGTEVGRVNMPASMSGFNIKAKSSFNGEATFSVPTQYFRQGENVIAVELHRYLLSGIKTLFDLGITYQLPSETKEEVLSTTLNENVYATAYYVKSNEVPAEKNIVINEVVSSNQDVMDEYASKDDYIELYNKGSESVDIGGWYLTDTPSNMLLSRIPTTDPSKTTIAPGGRLILWADDQAEQGLLHLGFKLGKEGETIVLSHMLGNNVVEVIDSISYPSMGYMSYSRIPDGGSTWAIQGPTFNMANTPNDVPRIETSTIAIYPTQVTESFTVYHAEGRMVSIIDLTGKVLSREMSTSDEMTIQAGELKRGMYIVTVGDKSFKIMRR